MRVTLTPEQLAYARQRYRKGVPGRGVAPIARALGVSDDVLRRHLDPDYRRRRNAASLKWHHATYAPTGNKPWSLRKAVTIREVRLP